MLEVDRWLERAGRDERCRRPSPRAATLLVPGVRAGDRAAEQRLLWGVLQRRAAPGRARRRDGRRHRQGRRRSARRGPPGAHARRRPRRDRQAGVHRRCRRAARPSPWSPGRAVARCWPRRPTDVADALAQTGPASVEWKLDGARIQAHRSDGDVRLFTRNLNEITDRLPGVVDARRRRCPAATSCSTARSLGRRRRRRRRAGSRTRWATSVPRPRPGAAGDWRPTSSTCSTPAAPPLVDEPLAVRRERARRGRAGAVPPAVDRHGRRRRGRGVPRRRRRTRPRGRDGQGARLAVRRRPARWRVAQGQAGAHARPRRARRRVGPRPPPGLAVEPPPRRSGRRRRS